MQRFQSRFSRCRVGEELDFLATTRAEAAPVAKQRDVAERVRLER